MEKKHIVSFYINGKWFCIFLLQICFIFQIQHLGPFQNYIKNDRIKQKFSIIPSSFQGKNKIYSFKTIPTGQLSDKTLFLSQFPVSKSDQKASSAVSQIPYYIMLYQKRFFIVPHFSSFLSLAALSSGQFKTHNKIMLKRLEFLDHYNILDLITNNKDYPSLFIFYIFLRSYRLRPPPLLISYKVSEDTQLN